MLAIAICNLLYKISLLAVKKFFGNMSVLELSFMKDEVAAFNFSKTVIFIWYFPYSFQKF